MHVPGLERVAQFELDALDGEIAVFREAELEVRREPFGLERVAGALHFSTTSRKSCRRSAAA
jgi:hypothetical protein